MCFIISAYTIAQSDTGRFSREGILGKWGLAASIQTGKIGFVEDTGTRQTCDGIDI
jgi:hypothetical protein